MNKYFTDSSIVKNLTVSIDDEVIHNDHLLDVNITWDVNNFSIEAEILFNDVFNYSSNIPFNGKNTVNIFVMDIFEEYYNRDFVIVSLTEELINNKQKYIKLRLRDKISYTLDNLYLSKSFKDAKLSDIIEKYWSFLEYDNTLTISDIVNRNFTGTEIVHDFITVPQNISFLNFILNEINREGYKLYQTRTECILVKNEDILPSVLPEMEEKEYTEVNMDSNYMFTIFERSYSSNDVQNISDMPVSLYEYYDDSTKTFISTDKNLKDVYDDIKMNDFDSSDIQTTTGKKLYEHFDNNDKLIEQRNRDLFSTNNTIDIYVTGNFKYNKLLQKSYMKLKGNGMSTDVIKEGDKRLQGTYISTLVQDRIIGAKIVQKIELQRVDNLDSKG